MAADRRRARLRTGFPAGSSRSKGILPGNAGGAGGGAGQGDRLHEPLGVRSNGSMAGTSRLRLAGADVFRDERVRGGALRRWGGGARGAVPGAGSCGGVFPSGGGGGGGVSAGY